MLCCYQWSDPASADNHQTSDGANISSFPGQRRYVQTGENALAGAPPVQETHPQPQSPVSQTNIPTPMAHTPPQPQVEKDRGELVSVTVPHGLRPGQTIHVMHPDGSGLKIAAQIPDGLMPGEIFYIKAPNSRKTDNNNVFLPPSGLAAVNSAPEHPASSMPMANSQIMGSTANVHPVAQQQQQQQEPPPFSQCLDSPVNVSPRPSQHHHKTRSPQDSNRPTATTPMSPSSTVPLKSPPKTALLKVLVPPGARPGSVIHVQIPGENRKIAAQVPPNCTEFHVQYEPQQQQISQPVSAPPGQKLLKVQVPAGMKPGEMLHVRIPNEPDRVVKAQVPPGNVREFHVAYRPAV